MRYRPCGDVEGLRASDRVTPEAAREDALLRAHRAQDGFWVSPQTVWVDCIACVGVAGWCDRLAMGGGAVGHKQVEHEEYPHQSNEPEFVEKEGWYHGDAPADGSVWGAL